VRRADDLGDEARRSLGEPAPGAPDAEFLAAIKAGRRRQILHRRLATAAVVLALAGLGAFLAIGEREPAPPETDPIPSVAEVEPPPLVDDPAAALLLEAARLRLEGFGDPMQAPDKLRNVMTRYPRSRAAAEAAILLRKIQGSPR